MTSETQTYGVGILGNCCTHGAGMVYQCRQHPAVRVITGFEKNAGRRVELEEAMEIPCETSYEDVAAHPDVQMLVITSDPCDKADMVNLAAEYRKAVLINKPLCHTPNAAEQIKMRIQESGIAAAFDAPMVKGLPAYDKLMNLVDSGLYGKVIAYHHSFGMLFSPDFPIQSRWPERFDPAHKSGGGEMTNMGCYSIDYALNLLGRPLRVEARMQSFWAPYVQSRVENFGQIMLDYGSFWAMLSVGKQAVSETPGQRNALNIEFEKCNMFIDPGSETIIVNGFRQSISAWSGRHRVKSSLEKILDQMECGSPPDGDIDRAAAGVHTLCAAYQSALSGKPVALPLAQPVNPLFEPFDSGTVDR